MATLTVQNAVEGGGITFTAASASDVFANDGKTIIALWNDDVSLSVCTVTAQDTTASGVGFGAVTKADAVQSVEANSADIMGPFPTSAFNNASGQVAVGCSNVTDIEIAVIRVSGAT